MKIILYSTNCPKCKVLEQKMSKLNLKFDINNNVDKILELGFQEAPIVQVDEQIMNFTEAVKWIKSLEA